LIFIISCNGEKEESSSSNKSPRIRKQSSLLSPKSNQKHTLGEAVKFTLSSDVTIDSVALEYEDESTIYKSSEFEWAASQAKTGIQKMRLTVYMGGTSETHYPRVKFLSDTPPAEYTYEVVNEYNHDRDAYIQGLFFIGDTLVESTGREGVSKLSKLNLKTGQVYQSTNLESQYFGEGSTIWNNNIYYLTWESQTGFVYNRKLERKKVFHYSHEGWGMTTLGDTLVVSDGTEVIHFLDPRDLSEIGRLEVYTDKSKVINLNELEVIDGLIYANVYLDNRIVVIDPKSGKVLRDIDLSYLKRRFNDANAEVLNGIAYKPETGQIFVTGKLWPKLFEVNFIPKTNS